MRKLWGQARVLWQNVWKRKTLWFRSSSLVWCLSAQGAYLTFSRRPDSREFVWTLALECSLLVAGVIATLRFVKDHRRRRLPSSFAIPVLILVTVAAGVVGMFEGWNEPSRWDVLTDERFATTASVDSLMAVRGGEIVDLTLRKVIVNGQTHSSRIKASWVVWNPSGTMRELSTGDTVLLRGILSFPPILTASGTPLRSHLSSYGIFYEFSGQIEAVENTHGSRFARWRQLVDTSVKRFSGQLPSDQVQLEESIVFGGSTVSATDKQAFLQAGLLHVLAASGANVLLVEGVGAAVMYPLSRFLRMPFAIKTGWVLTVVWVFTGLCGFAPSILRAAWMATYRHLGGLAGRRSRGLDAMLFSAVMMSLLTPWNLLSQSAVLSFMATYAITQTLRPKRNLRRTTLWSRVIGFLSQLVRLNFYIELFMVPIIALYFQQWTPYSILSNLVAEPFLAVLLPSAAVCFSVAIAATQWPALGWFAHGAMFVLGGLTEGLVYWVRLVSTWPGALLVVPRPPACAVIAYYAIIVGLPFLHRAFRERTHHLRFSTL